MSVAPDATATHDAGSLLAWYDEHLMDDVALYDITRQAATLLSALLLGRKRAAPPGPERDRWAARRRLVKEQADQLDPGDRAALTACQEEWASEIRYLRGDPAGGRLLPSCSQRLQ
ncbi:MAG: hypothetical protein LBS56_08110 [Propionibacteriaceae bacterium]|jgi:hypothetical protein|nr:hypothetical protein [Propionibacteriaceae bacterium]